MKVVDLVAHDVRFPTSTNLDGSDAMNVGDYSAAYVILKTDTGLEGHGLTFTDALTPEEAILKRLEPTKARREAEMRRDGFPGYPTGAFETLIHFPTATQQSSWTPYRHALSAACVMAEQGPSPVRLSSSAPAIVAAPSATLITATPIPILGSPFNIRWMAMPFAGRRRGWTPRD